ncbi:glycosyltransferase family 4 protein [Motilibacter deserti]
MTTFEHVERRRSRLGRPTTRGRAGHAAPDAPSGAAPDDVPGAGRTPGPGESEVVGRVCVIVQNMPYSLDRRVRAECSSLVAAGYGVSVICPAGEGEAARYELDGVHVHTYAPPPATSGALSYIWEFAYCWIRTALLSLYVLRKHGFDVIQACNPPDTYWLLALLYKPFRKRFVYDQHDLCPEVFEARFGRRGLLYRAVRVLERGSYRVADKVVATNTSYRQIAMTRGRRSASDVRIVMSCPDPSRLRPGPAVPELRAGRRFLVTYLGIMGPQDGVDRLLRAIAHYVHVLGRTDCQFGLLGYGDSLPALRELADKLEIGPWVTFTGRVGPDEVRRWLSTADLGITPDPKCDFNDRSTMNKTLEYMAHGLPVVATDLVETRRSARGAAAYVTTEEELAEQVAALLDAPAKRKEMGALGRERIERTLYWDKQAIRYVGLFDELLGVQRRTIDLTGRVVHLPDRAAMAHTRSAAATRALGEK